MQHWLFNIFFQENYFPRGYNFDWHPEILWPQVVSKILIGISYILLASLVSYFFHKREDIKLHPSFGMFGVVIFLFCGITFLIDAISIWYPIFAIETAFLVVTAIISIATIILLVPLVPQALTIPSPQQLMILNKKLKDEINKRYQSEKRARFLTKFSESIINSSQNMILAFDKDKKLTMWNKYLETVSGYKEDEVRGKNILELFPIIKENYGAEYLDQVLQGQNIHVPDRKYSSREGYYDAQLLPMFNNENEVIGGIVIVHDISELKSVQEIAMKNETKLKEAQALAKIGHWEWHLDKNVIKWSDELYRIYELKIGLEINLETFMERVHPEDEQLVKDNIDKALKNKQSYEFEHRVLMPDGSVKWISARGMAICDENGKVIQLQGTGQDITARREIENKIRIKNEELEERVRERTAKLEQEIQERAKIEESLKLNNRELTRINNDLDKFVYTASHDLKAPVTNMESLVKLLFEEMKAENKESKKILHMLNVSVMQLKNIIQELIEITKIQKNIDAKVEKVHMKELLEEIKFSIKDMITVSNAVIHDNFSECPYINFSKINLRSILYNLLNNAIKYRSPGRQPFIEIFTTIEDGCSVLAVKDNGLGIDLPSSKDKLFRMFKRLHDHVEGSGIGLYIIHRMMENCEGKIEVESELGKGSTFKVYFQIKKE